MAYRDSVGNTYAHLPPKPPTHSAKSTKTKEGKRRLRNAHRIAKFQRQFARTEANKKRRAERRARWLEKRRAKRAQGVDLREAA